MLLSCSRTCLSARGTEGHSHASGVCLGGQRVMMNGAHCHTGCHTALLPTLPPSPAHSDLPAFPSDHALTRDDTAARKTELCVCLAELAVWI